jgi:hypothetical protein
VVFASQFTMWVQHAGSYGSHTAIKHLVWPT